MSIEQTKRDLLATLDPSDPANARAIGILKGEIDPGPPSRKSRSRASRLGRLSPEERKAHDRKTNRERQAHWRRCNADHIAKVRRVSNLLLRMNRANWSHPAWESEIAEAAKALRDTLGEQGVRMLRKALSKRR